MSLEEAANQAAHASAIEAMSNNTIDKNVVSVKLVLVSQDCGAEPRQTRMRSSAEP